MSREQNKQAILKERARSLTARGTRDQRKALHERVVVVTAGPTRYGLALSQLREIARATQVTPLPGLPAFMPGVSAIRNELVSVVDLAELRGEGRTGNAEFFALVEVSGRALALWFAALLEMRDIFEEELVSDVLDQEQARRFTRAVTRDGVVLLDVPGLMASECLLVGQEHGA